MSSGDIPPISCAVEGVLDEAVLRRLASETGMRIGTVYGKRGKSHLEKRIEGFNNAARQSPWIVLVDLDRDEECAPPLRQKWLPSPATCMYFRVAVRAVEAWLMADHEKMAGFLRVPQSNIPPHPEELADPKRRLVDIAARSRSRNIREEMVPRPNSGSRVGPGYTTFLIEYVQEHWRPRIAAQQAPSLHSCMERMREISLTFLS